MDNPTNPGKYPGLFVNTSQLWAPFKMSFEGFAGSGKTFTEACIALGIWLEEGKKGEVFLIDTEMSAKFIVPFMSKFGLIEGQNLFVSQTRSLLQWLEILNIANSQRGNILLVDTVSHIYEEMMLQFERDNRRKVKYPQDAMIIKPMWKEKFATPFVDARNCHILFTGRAAWEYTMQEDEDTGKKSFNATGVKMRGDNEIAYEPDVVVLMERLQKVGSQREIDVARGATIMKDRSRLIDGKFFAFNPLDEEGNKKSDDTLQAEVWAAFAPVYRMLAAGNKAVQPPLTEADKKLGPLFVPGQGEAWYQKKIKAENTVKEIAATFDQWGIGGTGGVEKAIRATLHKIVFDNRTYGKLAELEPHELEEGAKVIEHMARYAAANAEYIEKLFKEHEQEKLFDYLKTEVEEYHVQLNAPDVKLDDDDQIPDFSSGLKTLDEAAAQLDGLFPTETVKTGPESLGDITPSLTQKQKEQADKSLSKRKLAEVEDKIRSAKPSEVDKLVAENGEFIAKLGVSDRRRLELMAAARKSPEQRA